MKARLCLSFCEKIQMQTRFGSAVASHPSGLASQFAGGETSEAGAKGEAEYHHN
jgi:hypothetical protein